MGHKKNVCSNYLHNLLPSKNKCLLTNKMWLQNNNVIRQQTDCCPAENAGLPEVSSDLISNEAAKVFIYMIFNDIYSALF